MFGYRADEAVGQTLDLIVPERLAALEATVENPDKKRREP